MNLNDHDLQLAKSDPRKFLIQYQSLVTKLTRILNEIELEEQTSKLTSDERLHKLVAEAKAIKEKREAIYNLLNEKVINET